MKFQIYRTRAKQFGFRLVANNGKIIAQSEGYRRKNKALKTLELIKRDAWDAKVEDITSVKAKGDS